MLSLNLKKVIKLKFYGITGTQLNWLDNYLKIKYQIVDFENSNLDLHAKLIFPIN